MANECDNSLYIQGSQSTIDDFIYKVKGLDGEFTFETILPIPKDIESSSDWCYKNYGTDSFSIDSEFKDDSVFFCTKWTPPIEFFEYASKQYPSLRFELQYFQPNDDYCGIAVYENAECIRDESDGCRSQLARDIYGDEYINIYFANEDERGEQ